MSTLGPTLETERLILRPTAVEDFDAWAAFMADAEAALVIRDAVFDDGEGAGGGGDAGGEFATGIVRAQALQMVGGECDEFGHADAVIIKRVFQEGGERSHSGRMGVG